MLLVCPAAMPSFAEPLPDGLVCCEAVIPGIRTDLRYATPHNFVGETINGYLRQRCILTRQATLARRNVQEELRPFGLGLKVFDTYRPQRAVDQFVRWASNPGEDKGTLLKDNYIAARWSENEESGQ